MFSESMVNITLKSEIVHYSKGFVKGIFSNVFIAAGKKGHFC